VIEKHKATFILALMGDILQGKLAIEDNVNEISESIQVFIDDQKKMAADHEKTTRELRSRKILD